MHTKPNLQYNALDTDAGNYNWQNDFYKEMDKDYPRAEHIPEIKDSVELFQKVVDRMLSAPAGEGMQWLKDKLQKQMDLLPEESTPSDRGLYDGYLNCLNWIIEMESASPSTATDEQSALSLLNKMCEESLSPERFEKWEDVVVGLKLSRKNL